MFDIIYNSTVIAMVHVVDDKNIADPDRKALSQMPADLVLQNIVLKKEGIAF